MIYDIDALKTTINVKNELKSCRCLDRFDTFSSRSSERHPQIWGIYSNHLKWHNYPTKIDIDEQFDLSKISIENYNECFFCIPASKRGLENIGE